MIIIIVCILVGTFFFIACATYIYERGRRTHKGLAREEFVRAFRGIPPEIPDAVYTHSTDAWFYKNLRVRPEDSYETILRMGEEDVYDNGKHLVKKLGLKMPPSQVLTE